MPRPVDRPGRACRLDLHAPGAVAEGHHQVNLLPILVTEMPEPDVGIGPPGQSHQLMRHE